MILADTMLWFFVVVGLLISFNGIWLMSQAMWTGTVQRAVEIHRHSMWKSFFIGLPIIAVGVIAFLKMSDSKNGVAGLVGIMLISCLFLFSSVGVAGIAALFGERLAGEARPEPLWKLTLRGGSVLALSYLFPLAGQIVILPISLIVGCGSAVRALWHMRNWKVVKVEVRKIPSASDPLAGLADAANASQVADASKRSTLETAAAAPRSEPVEPGA
jgi:hypothetical protein